jgi:hypothetical protein
MSGVEASVKFWHEPSGYWSASVVIAAPGSADWEASATNFHDGDEAMEWARQQFHLAVSMRVVSEERHA